MLGCRGSDRERIVRPERLASLLCATAIFGASTVDLPNSGTVISNPKK